MLLANVDESLQSMLANKTLSLESQLAVLQKQSTMNELPPALHAIITNAISAEVKHIAIYDKVLFAT